MEKSKEERPEKKDNIKPILIIGAGPTGLTAAMELSRYDIPVRLIEKLESPLTTSRALAVQARTLELFEQRGLAKQMIDKGNIVHAASIYGKEKRLGQIDLTEMESSYNFILTLPQADTEAFLRERLAQNGIEIEWQTRFIAFAQDTSEHDHNLDDGVTAILRKGDGELQKVQASYIICAEGSHSVIRKTLNLPFKGDSLRQDYTLGDLYIDGELPEDELSIFPANDGFTALFPMGDQRFRIMSLVYDMDHDKGKPDLKELQAIYDETVFIPGKLRDVQWSSRFHINSRMLGTLHDRNIFFGGDSAHVHSPAGGQGMNTGIQDMINLGWKLAMVIKGNAKDDLLDTYGKERLPVIDQVVHGTERGTDIVNSESKWVNQLVQHISPLFLKIGAVQKKLTNTLGQVSFDYKKSDLSHTETSVGTLKSGERIPDVDLLAGDDGKKSLFEILNPSKFSLLVTGKEILTDFDTQLEPWRELLEVHYVRPTGDKENEGKFETIFGKDDGLIVVRPDGYIGFMGREKDLAALKSWMHRWFVTT